MTLVKPVRMANENTKRIHAAVKEYLAKHPHLLTFDVARPARDNQNWRRVAVALREAQIYSPTANLGDVANVARRIVMTDKEAGDGSALPSA